MLIFPPPLRRGDRGESRGTTPVSCYTQEISATPMESTANHWQVGSEHTRADASARIACALCAEKEAHVLATQVVDFEYGAPGEYNWLRCLGCGLVTLDPEPSDEVLAKAYPTNYHGYHEPDSRLVSWYVDLRRRARAKMLSKMLTPHGSILDIGCGSGALLAEIGKLGSFNLLGVEYQADAAQAARDRGATVWTGELENADIQQASVDVALMEHVIEHVRDPQATLSNTRNLIKPGGLLLGETPNLSCLDAKLFGRFWGGGHAPRHLTLFTPTVLTQMLQAAGFVDIRIGHPVYPAHMALSIQHWLRRHQPSTKGLVRGRAWYFPLLCSLLMPVAILAALCRHSGAMRFVARRPHE